MLELKKLGIEVNHPPTKLKTGTGDAVVGVLLDLAKRTIQTKKFRYKKAVIPSDEAEDGGADEGGAGDDDGLDGGQDIADLANQQVPDEDDDEFVDFGGLGGVGVG